MDVWRRVLGEPGSRRVTKPIGRPRKKPLSPEAKEEALSPKPKKTRVTVRARPRSLTRHQYLSCDILQKQRVVAYAKENMVAEAARKFHVADSTVRGWMKIAFEVAI